VLLSADTDIWIVESGEFGSARGWLSNCAHRVALVGRWPMPPS